MSMKIVNGVFLADTARLLGELEIGEEVSLWYGAVVRGDVARIVIGAGSNVQDNAVIHCDSGQANVIGANVTIGHGALVHGESIGEGTLIGMHATVLGHTKIGRNCLIAAGAVVPPGLEVPDGMVVMGLPGKIVRPTSDKEKEYMRWLAPHYRKLARLHCEQPDHPRIRAWGAPAPESVAGPG